MLNWLTYFFRTLSKEMGISEQSVRGRGSLLAGCKPAFPPPRWKLLLGMHLPCLTSIWPTRLGCSLPWPPWLAPLLGQPWVQVERWFFLMLINTSSDHCSQASMPSGKIHQLRKKTGEAFISFLNSWGYFTWTWPGIDLDFLAGAGRCCLHIMLFFTHLDCWLISQGFARLYFCRKQKL